MSKVLVTGTDGAVGAHLIHVLRAWDVDVRAALHRDLELPGDVEPVWLDLADPESWWCAVDGCDAVFLTQPPGVPAWRARAFIDVARRAGASLVVLHARPGTARALEAHLVHGAAPATILRTGLCAQVLAEECRADIVDEDRIYLPAEHAAVPLVDARDVADVAAMALIDRAAHAGRVYTLTGPRRCSFTDAARALSDVLGRRIRYAPASLAGYARRLRRRGASLARIAWQTWCFSRLRDDHAVVDPTLARLLGWPGHSLHDYVSDHAGVWAQELVN